MRKVYAYRCEFVKWGRFFSFDRMVLSFPQVVLFASFSLPLDKPFGMRIMIAVGGRGAEGLRTRTRD